ncbi:MAG TPA: hypothetical protein VHN16_17565 [Streptosporangiaceae bacterium]|nr:hypothetical protein [Streptosporangiaceae bacterium]
MNEAGGSSRYVDPQQGERIGAEVLAHGLPVLPDVTYQMSVPVAYWTAGRCAVVLFLHFREFAGEVMPMVGMRTFSREGDRWSAHRRWSSTGWSHDPVADPGGLRDLGGGVIAGPSGMRTRGQPKPGYPASVAQGRVAPVVKQIALVQDGREDRRRLESHFGAWVVCTERTSAYQVAALDENGMVLDSIEGM